MASRRPTARQPGGGSTSSRTSMRSPTLPRNGGLGWRSMPPSSSYAVPSRSARRRSSPRCRPPSPISSSTRSRSGSWWPCHGPWRTSTCRVGCCGVVLASFQKEQYYRQSEHRWRELARSAEIAAVYAAFPSARPRRRARPREIPLEASSPVQREWAITCVSQLFTACLAGWQLPARPGAVDGRRVYETVWTTRPASVLQVLGTYVGLSRPHAPDLAERLLGLVEQTGRPPSNDGSVADALANRMVAYVIETLDRRAHAEVSGDRPAR